MRIRRFLVLLSSFVVVVTASAQILTCSSNDGKRNWCYGKTANGVRLVRQLCRSPCIQGTSWGYGTVAIWVDHGCRADFALNAGGGQPQTQPQDAMRSCKNTVGERLPNVPLAYISVNRGADTGNGSYMINFQAQPPRGPNSSGFCVISKNGQLQNFQFNRSGGNAGGGNFGGTSPQDAMRSCKNTAGERLPRVPLAYISVYRGSDTGNGNYMINFHAQPPGGPNSSGFCIISKNGQLQNFQFDPGSGNPGGGYPGNPGGQSPMDAMRLCKNAVSARQPNVPLAFIHVDQASVTGGSYSVNFRSLPPNGPSSSGYCDVFKNAA